MSFLKTLLVCFFSSSSVCLWNACWNVDVDLSIVCWTQWWGCSEGVVALVDPVMRLLWGCWYSVWFWDAWYACWYWYVLLFLTGLVVGTGRFVWLVWSFRLWKACGLVVWLVTVQAFSGICFKVWLQAYSFRLVWLETGFEKAWYACVFETAQAGFDGLRC